jgi:hypothetical protein
VKSSLPSFKRPRPEPWPKGGRQAEEAEEAEGQEWYRRIFGRPNSVESFLSDELGTGRGSACCDETIVDQIPRARTPSHGTQALHSPLSPSFASLRCAPPPFASFGPVLLLRRLSFPPFVYINPACASASSSIFTLFSFCSPPSQPS